AVVVEAGARFAMRDGTYLRVGQSDAAGLHLAGTPERPIRFAGARDEPGAWYGIAVKSNARESILENVVVRDAGKDNVPGVASAGGAPVGVGGLACQRCAAAALSYACGAKVTAKNVTGEGGTKAALVTPSGCK